MSIRPRSHAAMAHPDLPEPMPRTVREWAWVLVEAVVIVAVVVALVWLFAIYGAATGTPPYAP